MKKSELKNSMVVETREGFRYLVIDDMLMRDFGCLTLQDYYEDLIHEGDECFDIVKVFDCVNILDKINKCNDVIWRRQEPKEMTLKELEDVLGYPIKIVRGEYHER